MREIKLSKRVWQFDENSPLGPGGGFGRVFACPENTAIKKLHVTAAQAKRELTLAETLAGQDFAHVVPVLDAGEDADTGGFYIVMPRCDMSLADHVKNLGTHPDLPEAISILKHIALGLQEVKAIIHRDLKPDNVLLHETRWKVADFGIAKFVEDSTSLNTMRDFLTPPYAAPEQWRNEHTTKATDIYALGCIAHVLLSDSGLFEADDLADWQRKHLTSDPKRLPDAIPSKLRSSISLMLRKSPETRPSLERVISSLDASATETPTKFSALSAIDAEISSENAKREAAERARKEEERKAANIAQEADRDIYRFRNELFEIIKNEANNAISKDWEIALGPARLAIRKPGNSVSRTMPAIKVGPWTVFTYSTIEVAQYAQPQYSWSASLWFGSDGVSTDLRWYQLSFMNNPMVRFSQAFQPYAADPQSREAQAAFSNAASIAQLAETPRPVDAEDFEDFANEWVARFEEAARGRLRTPSYLPLSPRR